MLKRSIALLTTWLIISLFSVVAAQSRNDRNALPEIGVVASDAVSIDKEMLIGDVIMRQMQAQAPLVNDPVLTQ